MKAPASSFVVMSALVVCIGVVTSTAVSPTFSLQAKILLISGWIGVFLLVCALIAHKEKK